MSSTDTLLRANPPRRAAVAAAVAVHVYTAAGAVLAFLMVVTAVDGQVTAALWLFLVAMVIDGTDGLLARRLRVKEVTPGFDGALLDNIVDYLTYCFAPVVLLWAGGFLPDGWIGWVVACLPLLASTYQFCRADAKTDDHFFLGFPSYWNVVAFYIVVLGLGAGAAAALRRGAVGAGVRAGEVRLPVPHRELVVHEHGRHGPLVRGVRRDRRPVPRDQSRRRVAVAGVRRVLRPGVVDADRGLAPVRATSRRRRPGSRDRTPTRRRS